MEIRVFNARRIGFIGYDKNVSLSLIFNTLSFTIFFSHEAQYEWVLFKERKHLTEQSSLNEP